jgi:DNA ligase (NAD+)
MTDLQTMPINDLEGILIKANNAYRNTDAPIMADEVYDHHIRELARRDPGHELLGKVEAEGDFGLGKVRHSKPMLSTAKSYNESDMKSWVRRILEAADDAGFQGPVSIKANAKLDGIAGRLENGVLASRGDGATGNDISHMLGLGLAVTGDGDGELVMPQAYFDDNLAGEFKHPRNVVSGAVSADNMRPAARQSMEDQAIRFVSYASLDAVYATTDDVIERLEEIRGQILGGCEYPTDGIILAVNEPSVRDAMGSTGHHHNWMLAAKTVSDTAEVVVKGVSWQVGRTGRLSPVVNIESVELSGAMISNITAHNAGIVENTGIGPGAVLLITRSGEVIPKIQYVISPSELVNLPANCPCCSSDLAREKDFLVCPNLQCSDRLRARFNHFFHILGTIDLFGPVACEKLVKADVQSILEVFALTQSDFEAMGFGGGQAANLVRELDEARTRPVDDYLVLAALGIQHLGRGDSKKILREVTLNEVPYLGADQIEAIAGFGRLSAEAISSALPSVKEDLLFLDSTLERIIPTPSKALAVDSPISGKFIVFTGTMVQGARPDMIKQAESLGATSQSAVNAKTNYLVAGEKTGASKVGKAEKLGVTILSEAEYLAILAG